MIGQNHSQYSGFAVIKRVKYKQEL